MREVVNELGPDPLEATQLGDVLEGQPGALAVPRSLSPYDQRRLVR